MYFQNLFFLSPSDDISVFCNNCIAGCVLHDFGIRFNSPTVNLIIEPADYVEFLSNLDYYIQKEIVESSEDFEKYSCPVGVIDNKIRVYFLHYNSFKEAKIKWDLRCKRINNQKLYFVLSEKDGCTYNDLLKFDSLNNCKRKIAFVHKEHAGLKDIFIVKADPIKPDEVLALTDWKGWFGKREYDVFNWRKWLN